MSSRKTAGRRGTTKKRAQRATSNVFAMFNQDQIQEFKEAFNMIDQVRWDMLIVPSWCSFAGWISDRNDTTVFNKFHLE